MSAHIRRSTWQLFKIWCVVFFPTLTTVKLRKIKVISSIELWISIDTRRLTNSSCFIMSTIIAFIVFPVWGILYTLVFNQIIVLICYLSSLFCILLRWTFLIYLLVIQIAFSIVLVPKLIIIIKWFAPLI